jgi:tetratricopeptide (TPR) repeat protein
MAAVFAIGTTVCAIGAVGAPSASAQSNGISIEISEQVFATMCALDAAGFDADVSTLSEMPGRLALRDDMLKLHGPATDALRSFYREHAFADSGETLSRYMTFALAIGTPPTFDFRFRREDLPPDVLSLEGFQPILASFYREARLQQKWVNIEPEYVRAVGRDDSPLRRIILITNAYLRELIKPTQRTFTVYVEPLAGNRANFRNFGEHYAIVIGASEQFPTEQVQHAYLHYMLDALSLRYRKELDRKAELLNVAAKAPRLPEVYRTDFVAFADECVIKAVELRLKKLKPQELELALAENDQNGFILVRPFVAQLQKFEKSEPAMSYYYPDVVAGIDVETEQKRLKTVTFAAAEGGAPSGGQGAAGVGSPGAADGGRAGQPSELEAWIAEGDRDIAAKDAAGAAEAFKKVLGKYPEEPRAIYGMAVAAVLRKDVDAAKENFEKIVALAAGARPAEGSAATSATAAGMDPRLLSWSHVYLGRIHDVEGDRELAVNEYRAALAVQGAPEAARVAAQRGTDAPYAPTGRPEATGTH